ncbi:adenosylmethionine--8-amino-7-oxononanoate transaminase [Arenibacter sp. GZD96]|uniref:adenosylmethionine--8-amino-7-oxononanoate transaminase n=1 Tax=Aurantibrevibacter litoralis TaxID=3106030 RepID=UPI002AFF1C0F|nr:adenosylmethionine--8-amino-7-oxononanoate transaminase [Arenibacter sp. GZD-96]MEA1787232.1 adenosylmethionine--8-amino-7-oxononanoate transaminase [Arenibacter sp. GZD-96]
MKNISKRDKQHLWHPLTQHKLYPDMLAITTAKGCVLTDEAGKEYIDGIASWYTCMYGHCNEKIVEKVQEQLQILDQVVFSGFTHQPAVALSEALIKMLPHNQNKLFFSDNGSTAVDIALKMALQYHDNRGDKRSVFLAFENGFHGDTFGAMSVSGLSVYNGSFTDFSLAVERIPIPTSANLDATLNFLTQRLQKNDIAAFIYEPLVQGAAAMQMYNAEHLAPILELVSSHKVLTIADEVMTGFGKTGQFFASDYIPIKPDMMCLSKALTAGMVPMAITTCTQDVFDAFYSDDLAKGLFHGHTYTANPIACAAALAGIALLKSNKIQKKIQRIQKWHQKFDVEIRTHPKVAHTRQTGIIYALDLAVAMERYGDLRNKLFHHFMNHGVFLRPLGNTIYILAPYTISKKQMKKIYSAIQSALDLV